MNFFTEDILEQSCIEIFQSMGYEYQFGPDISKDGDYPERESYQTIILQDRLTQSLTRINKSLPIVAINEAIRKIINLDNSPSMLINNKTFHKYITDGIDVSYRDKEKNSTERNGKIYLFDFENERNNDYLVINQYTVIEKHDRRPDLVIFINGLPISVIELKSASDEEATIEKAFNQIKTYQIDIPSLFNYNAFNIISDGINAKVGTITSNYEWYKGWRTEDGENIAPLNIPQYDTLIKGIFPKKRILDIISNNILFQDSDNESFVKILTGYHQYFGVKKAIIKTKKAISEKGDRKIGVVWHTQGSGKSLLMVFYAGGLIRELDNPTLVVITDRNDLDSQLFTTFSKSKDILRQTPVQANSRKKLRELLNNKESGGVIFTTIQKFTPGEDEDVMPVLTARKNVILIADEAHRSQYGLKAHTKADTGEIKFGYAKYMREALPNASYIGFTGTPIEFEDKSTPAVFGDYIDIYDMTRAVEDKSTVKIYYENRIIKLNLDETIDLEEVDYEIEEMMIGHEEYTKNKMKTKWGKLEAVVGAPSRVKELAKDILTHFEAREKNIFGKSMIVCMSRKICVDLYEEIKKIRPDWHDEDDTKGKIKIMMTGSASDPKNWQQHIGNKQKKDLLANRMKDNKDELKLVIVRDMWLTGFDVPSLNTIYIDKPMKGHNLMQAIARVNRVFKDKDSGLVVDYIGIAESLKKALKQFTDSDKKEVGIDTSQAIAIMLEKYEIIRDIFNGFDYQTKISGTNRERISAIAEGMNHIFELDKNRKDLKKDFIQFTVELAKSHGLCSATEEGKKIDLEVSYFKALKASIIKLEKGIVIQKKLTFTEINARLKQILSNSVISEEVIDVFDATGLKKPELSILSEEFLNEVRNMKLKNLAVELLKKLLEGKLKSISRSNLVQSEKFSEKLKKAMNQYNNKALTNIEVLEALIKMAKDFESMENEGNNLGLTNDEKAFYDALTKDDIVKELMKDDKILIKIAQDLSDTIRKSVTVDWQVKESARAHMRKVIKRLLKKHGYPPSKSKEAVDIVIKQVELMCSEFDYEINEIEENDNNNIISKKLDNEYKPNYNFYDIAAEKDQIS